MEPIIMRLLDENQKLLKFIDDLRAEIAKLKKVNPFQSDQLNEFAPSFAAAQIEYDIILKTKFNSYYKSNHESLDDVINAVRPALGKNGISLSFYTDESHGEIVTRLLHASGQWIASRKKIILGADDLHQQASDQTYITRYQAKALLGCAPSEDDDGNANAKKNLVKQSQENTFGNKQKIDYLPLTQDHFWEMETELEGYPTIAASTMKRCNVNHLRDMNENTFHDDMRQIRELIRAHNSVGIKKQQF